MTTCIDLQKVFGDKYRIDRDPAYFAEYGENARIPDPWYWRIGCTHGYIYPQGGELLGASTIRRGAIANRLAAVPGVSIAQDGDDGINVIFPIEIFDAVAKIMKPRKRRRLSPAHRKTLVAAGTAALERYRNFGFDSTTRQRDLGQATDFHLAC